MWPSLRRRLAAAHASPQAFSAMIEEGARCNDMVVAAWWASLPLRPLAPCPHGLRVLRPAARVCPCTHHHALTLPRTLRRLLPLRGSSIGAPAQVLAAGWGALRRAGRCVRR